MTQAASPHLVPNPDLGRSADVFPEASAHPLSQQVILALIKEGRLAEALKLLEQAQVFYPGDESIVKSLRMVRYRIARQVLESFCHDNPPSHQVFPDSSSPRIDPLRLQQALLQLSELEGFVSACLADTESGIVLAFQGLEGARIEMSTAAFAEILRYQKRLIGMLGLDEAVEDIPVTLKTQLHILRNLSACPELFLYLVLARDHGNLALARGQLAEVDHRLAR